MKVSIKRGPQNRPYFIVILLTGLAVSKEAPKSAQVGTDLDNSRATSPVLWGLLKEPPDFLKPAYTLLRRQWMSAYCYWYVLCGP